MGLYHVIRRAWAWSQQAHPLGIRKQHFRWTLKAALTEVASTEWFRFIERPEMRPYVAHDPRLAFKPLAHYQSNRWGWAQRAKVLHDTYAFIEAQGGRLREAMLLPEGRILAQLPLGKGMCLKVILKTDPKFRKEGELGVFLEIEPLPAPIASFALSLDYGSGTGWRCFVGAVQGRPGGDEDTIKAATKALHGFRPKAFVVFLAQEMARALKTRALFGVGNRIQIYRARAERLQKEARSRRVCFDYDALWEECGGEPQVDGWYRLPLKLVRRSAEEIKPNKRAMYAKRYALLDQVSLQIKTALTPFES